MKKGTKPSVVLVTAGPTRAYLDNVRYLSNYSSGMLGYEICRALETKVDQVIAVVGPCEAPFHKLKRTKIIQVTTVKQMLDAVMQVCKENGPSHAVLAAAVLDFEPKKVQKGKVSSKSSWKIELVPTPKIIDQISLKFPQVKKVAFKLEWKTPNFKNIKQFGEQNLKDKSAQALCLNYLSKISQRSHPAFFFTQAGKVKKLNSKKEIAKEICRFIVTNESTQQKKL